MYGFTDPQWQYACLVYDKLGSQTVNPDSRIMIRSWYGKDGANQAKAIGAVFTLRVAGMRYHLGNPFSSIPKLVKKDNLVLTQNTQESVTAFVAWSLYSDDDRAVQFRLWLSQGVLQGKPIIYYKELGEPSHATAIEWLIDNYNQQLIEPEK